MWRPSNKPILRKFDTPSRPREAGRGRGPECYSAFERFMAKRMGAKTIEVKASHLSLISYAGEITRLILEAAGQGS